MSKEFQSFYQDIAGKYEDTRYGTRYGRLHRLLHYRTLEALLADRSRADQVLEIACGTGHTSRLLATMGFEHIACDLTPGMMAAAREEGTSTVFFQADAFSLPIADCSCDVIISTRFLHLFPPAQQISVLREMTRVLKPGGLMVVDFDNLYARWIYVLPHVLYNLLRYRRLAPYSIYNSALRASRMISETGMKVEQVQGVGGWHLILPAMLSQKLAVKLGWWHRRAPLRWLAEQFVVAAHKP